MSEQPIPLTDTEREALAQRLYLSSTSGWGETPWAHLPPSTHRSWRIVASQVAQITADARAAALAPIQAVVEQQRSAVLGMCTRTTLVHRDFIDTMLKQFDTALAAAGVDAAPNDPACRCGESESTHDRIDPPHMFVAQDAAPNETTTEDDDPWCREESCTWRHWRSGGMPTHRRGADCPPRAAVPSGHEQEGDHRG